jgi:hypothetical protein
VSLLPKQHHRRVALQMRSITLQQCWFDVRSRQTCCCRTLPFTSILDLRDDFCEYSSWIISLQYIRYVASWQYNACMLSLMKWSDVTMNTVHAHGPSFVYAGSVLCPVHGPMSMVGTSISAILYYKYTSFTGKEPRAKCTLQTARGRHQSVLSLRK